MAIAFGVALAPTVRCSAGSVETWGDKNHGQSTVPGAFLLAHNKCSRFSYPGSIETMPFGINDKNYVVGWYSDSSGYHGFIKTGERFRSIDHPDAIGATFVTGINNKGIMVGCYGSSRGFTFDGRSFTAIDYPGVDYTEPFGINNNGAVVGFYWDGYATHGFLYAHGSFITLDMPGADATQPYSINDKGQIVGSYYLGAPGYYGAFLYNKDVFTDIAFPGAWYTSCYGINEEGEIGGGYYDRDGQHAFLYSSGRYAPVYVPSSNGSIILGINNRGYVVGYAY